MVNRHSEKPAVDVSSDVFNNNQTDGIKTIIVVINTTLLSDMPEVNFRKQPSLSTLMNRGKAAYTLPSSHPPLRVDK